MAILPGRPTTWPPPIPPQEDDEGDMGQIPLPPPPRPPLTEDEIEALRRRAERAGNVDYRDSMGRPWKPKPETSYGTLEYPPLLYGAAARKLGRAAFVLGSIASGLLLPLAVYWQRIDPRLAIIILAFGAATLWWMSARATAPKMKRKHGEQTEKPKRLPVHLGDDGELVEDDWIYMNDDSRKATQ